jgi:hypothetical protein
VTAEGEELGAIARRVIDPNRFVTVGTADEERVPSVSPVRYAPAEYRVLISTEASACRCEGLAIVE